MDTGKNPQDDRSRAPSASQPRGGKSPRLRREFIARLFPSVLGLATVGSYWPLPVYVYDLPGTLVLLPFVLLGLLSSRFWIPLLGGFTLLGLFWYSTFYIKIVATRGWVFEGLPSYLNDLPAIALVALPFTIVLICFRGFWAPLLGGAFLIGTLWYSIPRLLVLSWASTPPYLNDLEGMILIALPFASLLIFFRQFWTALLTGLLLLGLLRYSIYHFIRDVNRLADLIFILTLPLSYAVVLGGWALDRLIDERRTATAPAEG